MFSNNQFSAKQRSSKTTMVFLVCILCALSLLVMTTIAFFYHDDWGNNNVQTSGPVNILAVGTGDNSIEDTNTSNLVVDIGEEYDVLIPGMPIYITANCKVFKSNTHPLVRAKFSMTFEDNSSGETFNEETSLGSSSLDIGDKIITQIDDEITDNGWYLHTDGFYYYIGTDTTPSGADTIIKEVDFPEDKDRVVKFIDSEFKFPSDTTALYSGLGVKFDITFQAIQNFIPDDNGDKLPNTITNSLKIFNYFEQQLQEQTSLSYFTFSYNQAGTEATIGIADGVELPEHLILPTTDASGVPITAISNDFLKNNKTVKSIVIPSSCLTFSKNNINLNKNH